MVEPEQNPGAHTPIGRPSSYVEEVQTKGQREQTGKDPMVNHLGGANFEYVPCTDSDWTVRSSLGKGRIRSEVNHTDPSRPVIPPSIDKLQGETHRKQNHGLLGRTAS